MPFTFPKEKIALAEEQALGHHERRKATERKRRFVNISKFFTVRGKEKRGRLRERVINIFKYFFKFFSARLHHGG